MGPGRRGGASPPTAQKLPGGCEVGDPKAGGATGPEEAGQDSLQWVKMESDWLPPPGSPTLRGSQLP